MQSTDSGSGTCDGRVAASNFHYLSQMPKKKKFRKPLLRSKEGYDYCMGKTRRKIPTGKKKTVRNAALKQSEITPNFKKSSENPLQDAL